MKPSRLAYCGHYMTPENSIRRYDRGPGVFRCRACHLEKDRARYNREERERCRGCDASNAKIRETPMRLGYPVILCEECYQDRMDNPFYAAVDLPCDAG